jgi:hypothetical protein
MLQSMFIQLKDGPQGLIILFALNGNGWIQMYPCQTAASDLTLIMNVVCLLGIILLPLV